MRLSYFVLCFLKITENTILQGNAYIRQLNGEDNYEFGSGTVRLPEGFFLGLLKLAAKYDIATLTFDS
jgi:hypothetical protein